ncbi:MAG TPA: hypothetical protein DCO82_10200, partial [Alphaproteobacteria bacterium]|nr:hypothetical protein [Alphaproteobacteria bacterium]
LEGANLEVADFTGAHGIIEGPKRSDSYTFYLVKHETPMVKAGCRWMSISDYRERVATPGYKLAEETAAILDHLEAEAIKRGWIEAP